MEKNIVYYLTDKKRSEFKYSKYMQEQLKTAFEKVVIVNVNREEKKLFEYIYDIIKSESEQYFEFEHIVFISNDFFGPVCNITNFFEHLYKNRDDCLSLFKNEEKSNDFIFLCIKSDFIKEKEFNREMLSKPYVYLQSNMSRSNVYEMVVKGELPVIPIEIFIADYESVISSDTGEHVGRLVKYITDNTEYDEGYIFEYLLKTHNMADVVYNLQLVNIFPQNSKVFMCDRKLKVALVIHIYYEDLIEECYSYAQNMGSNCDVYITTDTEEKVIKAQKMFKKGGFKKCESILIENRGRDVSALLVSTKKFIFEYDLVCFAHDKKVKQLNDAQTGVSFSDRCYENILGSEEYIDNIIGYFEKNPSVGMAFPPPPNHGDYYPTLGYFDWGNNYDNVKELYKKLELEVEITDRKETIAPLGTMFWFRPAALKNIFDMDWKYEDFPQEPNSNDGTLLHAVERIYPFCVQNQGYYVSWIMNDEYAATEINNLYFMIKALNKKLFEVYEAGKHIDVINSISEERMSKKIGELSLMLKEASESADYYKHLAQTNEQTAAENMEVAHLYKAKYEDVAKTLSETQEMVGALSIVKANLENELKKEKSERQSLEKEIELMRQTRIWRFGEK